MFGRLISTLERVPRARILLVGDLMLDRYLWGDVERISPEAPIPVLRISKTEHRLGGVGSVASMLAALDVAPVLVTLAGDDSEGRMALRLLKQAGISTHSVLITPDRPTTLKERLLGRSHHRYPHHMMRVDRENDVPVPAELRERLLSSIGEHLTGIDLAVVSDYDKGVCDDDLVPRLIRLARSADVPVVVDPASGADFHRYAGAACITPNRMETGRALSIRIGTPEQGVEAAAQLLRFGVEAAAVTLDRDGIAWADARGNRRHFPCRPRQVFDITGAGDMVLAAISYCVALGDDYETAVQLANLAGGIEVERLGAAPLSRQELLAELSRNTRASGEKIFTPAELQKELRPQRTLGRRIVLANGCFDLLHPGHVAMLQEARRQGDCLVAAVNSDRSVRSLKGEGRPIVGQSGRAQMLAALACVDYVVVFDDTSVRDLLKLLLPDVLVKGNEYTPDQVEGHEIVARYGGRVVLVPLEPGYSTTDLWEKRERNSRV